jgi:hypothetical protein
MKRLSRRATLLTRERLVNPHPGKFVERVRSAGGTDLRGNYRVEHLGRGYTRMIALDPTRRLEP